MLVNKPRFESRMADEGLDAIVATTLENVHYFTGVYNVTLQMFPHGGQCYAILTADAPDKPFVVCPTLDTDQFVMDSIVQLRGNTTFGTFYREPPHSGASLSMIDQELSQRADVDNAHSSPAEALVAAIKEMGLADKKIGIDEGGLGSGLWAVLKDGLPGASLIPAGASLAWMRRAKTEEEIRRLRASVHVVENAIIATGIVREGVTAQELVREFERSVVSQGAIPKFALIRIGPDAVAGQSKPTRTRMQRGDTIWFDVGCVYEGYWSDIARNVCLGSPNDRTATLYEAMLRGEEHAIAEVRAGMTGRDVFELTMQATRANGAPHYRRHHVGHGIGAEVYEQPIMAPNNEELVEIGTVVNIETPYYEYALGALHVEDPFVVRPDGNEVLTTLTRQMIIVD
jgi:Xaa-Pro aminopeptidase